MLGHGLAGHGQLAGERRRAERLLREAPDHRPAGRVGQRGEDRVDGAHRATWVDTSVEPRATRAGPVTRPRARARRASARSRADHGLQVTRHAAQLERHERALLDGDARAAGRVVERPLHPRGDAGGAVVPAEAQAPLGLDLLHLALAHLAARPLDAQRRAGLGLELHLVRQPLAQLGRLGQQRPRALALDGQDDLSADDWSGTAPPATDRLRHRLPSATRRLR